LLLSMILLEKHQILNVQEMLGIESLLEEKKLPQISDDQEKILLELWHL
jgi:hypothetical protein